MRLAMAFRDFPVQEQGVGLLQRSLERGRLGHAYLFVGHDLLKLESLARTLAKALNCQRPVVARDGGRASDSCDACSSCRKIDAATHADMHWLRPESKSRVVTVEQVRDLMHEINLKPTEAAYKVGVIVAADRLNVQAANAFLKTLEEPPSDSVLILLTTAPERLLETILSRCLRLNFGVGDWAPAPEQRSWVAQFGDAAARESKSLLGRYQLLGLLGTRLAATRADVEQALRHRSPLTKYEDQDIEPQMREQWEKELDAAIEAEYRLRRADLLAALQMWFRDVWVRTQVAGSDLLYFPELTSTERVARRISPRQAMGNLQVLERLQRLLGTNVQEALALEVGLLKLQLQGASQP